MAKTPTKTDNTAIASRGCDCANHVHFGTGGVDYHRYGEPGRNVTRHATPTGRPIYLCADCADDCAQDGRP